jgi:vancomycin resistance protein YoaR
MTTQAEVAEQPTLEFRAFDWRRAAAWFFVTLFALFLFGAAFAFGYARVHDGRMLPGVDVGGVSVGGLSRAQAEAKLRQSLPDLSQGELSVEISGGAAGVTPVSYAELRRDYDMDAMLDQALGVGRAGHPLDQLGSQMRTLMDGVTVPVIASWDADRLAERIAEISAAAEAEPVDATITRPEGAYEVTPSVEGAAVDEAQALSLAMAALDNVSAADTQIEIEAASVAPAVTTAQAQAAADSANAVSAEALRLTASGTTKTIDAETINGWVRLEPVSTGEWAVVLEDAPIIQIVDQFKFEVDVPATNASYTFDDANPVVIPEADGHEIDREPAISAIVDALRGRADGNPATSLSLAVVPLAPEFTAPEAQALISRIERLSRWTTAYDSSARNGFGQNIRRPTNLIDGTVVQPGEEFDFVAIAGPITRANGYTDGAAIIHGNTQLDGVLGGGLCSASTTIFNAALRAGFEMGARRNHAYFIDRYPVGLDATIWINGNYVQTMTFTNDSEYPILIRGINRPGRVTYEIYGVPDGRDVNLSAARVWQEKESWTRFEYTDELEPGQTERLEYPFAGFQSSVTRTVTAANGTILHEDTFNSSYRRVVGHVRIGWSPGDPPPGTILEPNKPANTD